MSSTRPRPSSMSSSHSLMQDVPGAFPVRTSADHEEQDRKTYTTLSEAIHSRRAEYVQPKHIRIKIGTWNVAAYKGTEKDVGGWFVGGKGVTEALTGLVSANNAEDQSHKDSGTESVEAQETRFERKKASIPEGDPGSLPGDDDIDLYVLNLQEVVDIGSASEALRPYTDPAAANKWKDAMSKALSSGYRLVAEQQLIGLLLLVYAAPSLADEVKSVSTTSVGTGLMGYMGNKGAVTARIVIGDTTRMVFINSHLAAGADKTALERRNWDASQVVQRTRFEPIQDAMDLTQSTGEQIGDEDFAFWVGDLNYRLEGIPGDDVRRLLMLHTRKEYDPNQRAVSIIDERIQSDTETARRREEYRLNGGSNDSSSIASPRLSSDDAGTDTQSTPPSTILDEIDASEDPNSLQTTLSSLLSHDELFQQIKHRKAFHEGWREGPISFLPTYKYDIGSVGVFDSSEKHRAPSWCDRILYRTRRDRLAYEATVREEEYVKKKDDQMKARGFDQAGEDDDILYDYDPDTDGANAVDDYDEHDEHAEAADGVVITREGFEDELRLEYYAAHQRVLTSDHKPLNAVFTLKYDAVVPEMKAKVHAEVAKDLDKAENEGRPNVTVVVDQHNDTQAELSEDTCKDFEGVWFGSVRWGQSKNRTLTIANTSQSPATFNFIERPVGAGQAAGIAPSWLSLKLNEKSLPSSSTRSDPLTLKPGETATVDVEMRVFDLSLVQALNEGIQGLEDILVLRVEDGRDHFVPVRAHWLDTSLGRSINRLIRIPEGGIRKLQSQRPDSSKSRDRSRSSDSRGKGSAKDQDQPVRFSAPRELFRLTEAVEELCVRMVAEWDMISDGHQRAPWIEYPGWPFDEDCWVGCSQSRAENAMSEVCNALDTDQPVRTVLPPELSAIQQLYVLAIFLLLFLKGIPDGVISDELWSHIDAHFANSEKSKHKLSMEEQRMAVQELLSLFPSHSISFILIMSMLERIMQEVASVTTTQDDPPTSPSSRKLGGTLRRLTGTFARSSGSTYRQQACAAYARIFAGVLFPTPATGVNKASSAYDRRKIELLELFLRKDELG